MEKWVVSVCKANDDPYVPSNFQIYEYCRTKSHKKCPFFVTGSAESKEIRNFDALQNLTLP